MATVKRIRIAWTGWSGGPGVTTLYSADSGTPNLPTIRVWLSTFATILPTGITLQIENTGQTVDTATGKAVGNWSAPASAALPASGGLGAWAAPVGFMYRWKTGSFVGGREVTGKTFVVPIMASKFGSDGTLDDTTATSLRTAATQFVTDMGGTLQVLSRKGAGAFTVTSASVPDKAIVLRSRRA